MSINLEKYKQISQIAEKSNAILVAVSKTKPVEDIRALYDLGHRDFGENYVQELVDKQQQLPNDIRWHFIGHLQSNKVKYIAPFVHLIHGVDSMKLVKEINKQGEKYGRMLDILLQVHIAIEESKFGFDEDELDLAVRQLIKEPLKNVHIKGLMGMTSFSTDQELVKKEFRSLKLLYDKYANVKSDQISFNTLSMGMSGDFPLALAEGSNMIRVGSLIFGERSYGALNNK